jgi:membrane associated rhomboid family serine protease
MIPLHDDIRAVRRPYVNYALIGACTLVFAYQTISGLSRSMEADSLFSEFGMIPASIAHGARLWTLLTSMFVHGGFFHFAGNMLYLWIFGDNVEDAFGHLPYAVTYLLTGVLGSLLQILLSPHSTIPMIGASGAISGVMGVYIVLFPRARVLTVIPIFFFLRLIYVPAALLLGFWIVLQLLQGCSAVAGSGGVAYFAHIGGFGAGVLLGLVAKSRTRRPWYEIH